MDEQGDFGAGQTVSDDAIVAAIAAKRKAATGESPSAPAGEPAQQQAAAVEQAAQPAEEQQPAEPEQQSAIDLASVRVPVTYRGEDGKDVTEELSVDDLRKGFQGHRDYARLTKEVADERGKVAQTVDRATAEARKAYLDGLTTMQNLAVRVIAPELANVDWAKLAQENPTQYVALRGKADQLTSLLGAIKAQGETQTQQQKAKDQEARTRAAGEAVATLRREIPGWSDEHYNRLLTGAVKTYGYALEDYGNRTDARDIMVLNDALKYRELMAKKPATEAALKAAPQTLRPGATPARTDQDEARITKAKKALEGSGEIDDAVALMRAKRQRG